jgi:hypothetical protein
LLPIKIIDWVFDAYAGLVRFWRKELKQKFVGAMLDYLSFRIENLSPLELKDIEIDGFKEIADQLLKFG